MIYKSKKELANIRSFYNQFGIKIEMLKFAFQSHHLDKLPKLSKAFQSDKQPWILTWETLSYQRKWISIMNNTWHIRIKIIEFKDKSLSAQVSNMQQPSLRKKEDKLFNLNKVNHKMPSERKKSTLWTMMTFSIQLLVVLPNLFKFQLPRPINYNSRILSAC